jgi:hypothetical protein
MAHADNPTATDMGGLTGHIDITPAGCDMYARIGETDRCPDVVLLNANASTAQLLGFAYGRCRELAMLANLASSSHAAEGELRQCAEHLWIGLETLLTVLDCMDKRIGGAA